MPRVILHKNGQTFEGDVDAGANLVVRAGIRRFPFPHLAYGCGMGKCGKCACRILGGGANLPEPNWKEKRQLGERIAGGYRLACQLWIEHDIELAQDSVPLPVEA
ncbi:MAG: 2Fe-2S iron-sulfur cluster-binding protein [Acetobacteraceae bacterium]